MHQPLLSGVLEGQATDLEIEAKEMLRLRDILFAIYAKATGKDQEIIHADCERNYWLDPKEMLEYGLIDEVLTTLPSDA
jgi:ATP-dependent Clp protease protease subunit